MKLSVAFLCLLFCSSFSIAQNTYFAKTQLSKRTILSDSAVYVIDGEVSANQLKGLNPASIFSIDVLEKRKTTEMLEGEARHGFVVVVTKANAVNAYQKKFSSYSADYQKLLAANKGDKDFEYIINGHSYKAGKDDCTRMLYNLKPEEILSVKIDDDMGICLDHSVTVRIKTKK